jgi:hypothetical protein
VSTEKEGKIMRRRQLRIAFCYLSIGVLVSFLGCTQVLGQATAQIAGAVKDQTGAVLPGVEVTATQTDTGAVRNAITNETGSYLLTNLPIGPYKLEVSLPGFRTYVQTGIVLQVNSSPVINAVLEVGQVAETVEVQANAALVETRSVGVGQVVENDRILELPLNGRQVTELIGMAGAAATVTAGGGGRRDPMLPPDGVSVAGASDLALNFTLDGANHNNAFNNQTLSMPFPDAMQEFKVEMSATSAQNGTKSAGTVAAVTKSGTNQFHGDLFEFVRNYKFNARNSFAARGDSLKRNQFGGTLGGPVLRNKLFFFGGYQGTITRQDPAESLAFVPTAAMFLGDFTAFASPACNVGRQITLASPFVNNRIDPGQFSPVALKLARLIRTSPDPCGRITRGNLNREDRRMITGRMDYQWSANHSVFGRYLFDSLKQPTDYELTGDPLGFGNATDARTNAFTLGLTSLYGPSVVNSIRLTGNHWLGGKVGIPFTNSWPDLGVKMYSYEKKISADITGGFGVTTGGGGKSTLAIFAVGDDLSILRGNHQMAFGGSGAAWWANSYSDFYSYGRAVFNGQTTGLGMADYFLGKVSAWTMGTPAPQHKRSKHVGLYAADTWKLNPKLTVNYGLRWEPYFPMIHLDGSGVHFDLDGLRRGVKTTQFTHPTFPMGLSFSGDPGFPGESGMYNQWRNFSPRLGLAWDVNGNGRTSVRASAGTFYDYPHAFYQVGLSNAPPWSQRTVIPDVQIDNPWANFPGGDPFPMGYGKDVSRNINWNPFSVVTALDYDTPNTQVMQWNLSLQRQIGADWLASATYIGSGSIHLWALQQLNPAVFIPGNGDASGNCFLNGQRVPFTVRAGTACSTTGNTNQRRRFYLENPVTGGAFGTVNRIDSGATAGYNGLLLSIQRRAVRGVTLNGNYTWSHCISDPVTVEVGNSGNADGGYNSPNNRNFDRGNCRADRRHIFNLSSVAATPQFSNRALNIVASGWRFSNILKILSGDYMAVTVRDRSLDAISGQRANQVLPNPYGNKTIQNYLNPAAFDRPALGTLGNLRPYSIAGPGTWQFDIALSRTFQFRETQKLEFRAEAFNVTNSFRMTDPVTNFDTGNFGQVTTARDPRIMQFALKYLF